MPPGAAYQVTTRCPVRATMARASRTSTAAAVRALAIEGGERAQQGQQRQQHVPAVDDQDGTRPAFLLGLRRLPTLHARIIGSPGNLSCAHATGGRARLRCRAMSATIAVLEGDQTGQELLDEALRVIAPEVIGITLELQRFDLSLANRRATANAVVLEAADAMIACGYGIKAATVTPE